MEHTPALQPTYIVIHCSLSLTYPPIVDLISAAADVLIYLNEWSVERAREMKQKRKKKLYHGSKHIFNAFFHCRGGECTTESSQPAMCVL